MKLTRNLCSNFFLFGPVLLFCLVLAPVGIAQALEHTGAITEDETWMATDNPHEITGNVTVDNLVTLTLEPGVEVIFQGNYFISVYGALMAEGVEENGIRFTRGPGVAHWYGLYLYSGSGGIFAHCTIEWAGQRGIYADSCYLSVSNCTIRHNINYGIYATAINPCLADNIIENNGTGLRIDNYYAPSVKEGMLLAGGDNNVIRDNDTGIYFYDCIMPTLAETALIENNTTYGVRFRNCVCPRVLADISSSGTGVYYQNCTNVSPLEGLSLIDNTGAYGAIFAQGSGPVTLGIGNTISGNYYPLSIDLLSYITEESTIPGADNQTDGIKVSGATSDRDITWYDFGAPYIVTATPTVAAAGSLTVEPGVTVRLGANTYLSIYGELQANGTSENGITFTRDHASRWDSLYFRAGSSGALSHTNVEFAASGIYVNGAAYQDPEVDRCILQNNTQGYYGYSNATSLIHDCLITNNDYGIRLQSGSMPGINNNSIKQNCSWGVHNANLPIIDAEDNFWGDATGPRHDSNPDGRGDFVSDLVDFDPWLPSDPL
jgi:hypothetical protein